MLWKALGSWLAWTGAHAVAGLLLLGFVVLVPPFSSTWSVLIDGLAAGILFGLGQWSVLRWSLPSVRFWFRATVFVSPVSWGAGVDFAVGTLSFGGWLGGLFSASVQAVLLWDAMRDRRHSILLAVTYFGAAMLGSLLFYYGFLIATSAQSDPYRLPPPAESMLLGSVAFGALTGIVVALFVWFSASPAAKPAEAATVNSGTS